MGSVRLGDAMLKSKCKTLPDTLKLIFALAIVLGLSSCKSQGDNLETLDPNLYDQSWLTGKPCAAPCWYGLEPGMSSREDSITKVEQLPFIDSSSKRITGLIGAGFQFKKNQEPGSLTLGFKDDVLDAIYFHPNYQITFDQAVEKLGSPDGFWLRPIAPDAGGCELMVIWKNKRIILWKEESTTGLYLFGGDLCTQVHDHGGKLPRNMLVEQVEIDLPGLIETLMKQDSYNPWKGFAN